MTRRPRQYVLVRLSSERPLVHAYGAPADVDARGRFSDRAACGVLARETHGWSFGRAEHLHPDLPRCARCWPPTPAKETP